MEKYSSREELLQLAKVCEQAERYDQMAELMKKVVDAGKSLTNDERNLFSVAYKNVVGARRSSWRAISSIEHKLSNENETGRKLAIAKEYRGTIEAELTKICAEVQELLQNDLIPAATTNKECTVFYKKMQGDYFRYLTEVSPAGDEGQALKGKSLDAYTEAMQIAEKDLDPTHPIRLGLALNFSVFYFEIMTDRSKACEMAKKAFDDAISELDQLQEESYKDSTLIMQLLRDNLCLWTEATEDSDDQQQ